MALHHRPNLGDIRSAYDTDRSDADSSRSTHERYSSASDKSYQTAPTDFSTSPPRYSPVHVHYRHGDMPPRYFFERDPVTSPNASVETYASTVSSDGEDAHQELPEYDVPAYNPQQYDYTSVIPATPADFSELFPSRRRLAIRHDDSTLDGNMNLRIDTDVSSHGRKRDITLFHLRMHDLKNREFSLRRYCRDSGREVCHSSTRIAKPSVQKRPGFQRSLSNALHSMRPKSESKSPTTTSLTRNDSGYGSMHSVDFALAERPRSADTESRPQQSALTNAVKLEFSNYAQVEVKRTGVKGNKRYEFAYWGTTYSWRRSVHKDRGSRENSYHLVKSGSDRVLAYIVPTALTTEQAREERSKGGWIPPCTMWITDEDILRGKDVSDVVVASGLIALVDDSIRARFHSKNASHLLIPMATSHVGSEYLGPKRLINEIFRRDSSSSQQSRPSTSNRPSTASTVGGTRVPASTVRQPSHER